MSDESNALLALKNAWTGAVSASSLVRDAAPSVLALPEDTPLSSLDLDTFHHAALTQANAAQALRGLIEELRRHRSRAAEPQST
jgi:hypothetical protein